MYHSYLSPRAFMGALACVVAIASGAQVPRPVAPLVPYRMQQPTAVQTAKPQRAPRAAAPRRAAPQKKMLTGWTYTSQQGTADGSVTYDDIGRVATLTDDGLLTTYAYDVHTTPDWTRRVGTSTEGSDTVARLFDARGRLIRSTQTVMKAKEKRRQTYYYAYNASPQGEITGSDEYDWDSELGTFTLTYASRKVWFPLRGEYLDVPTYYPSTGDSTAITLAADGLSYTTTTYRRSAEAQPWWKSTALTRYFSTEGENLGSITVRYTQAGEIDSYSGDRTVEEFDVPQKGWVTLTSYTYSSSSYVDMNELPGSRYEQTVGYDAPLIPGGAARERISYTYNLNTHEWKQTEQVAMEWLYGDILHTSTTDKNYKTTDTYARFSPQGEPTATAELFTGGYVCIYNKENTDKATYLDYYDDNRRLTQQVRYTDTYGATGACRQYETLNAGVWTPATGTLQLAGYEVTLNADGTIAQMRRISTDDGIEPDLYVYTYTATGYEEATFWTNWKGENIAMGKETYTLLADGTVRHDTYKYDDDGQISSARREDRNASTGLNIFYTWSSSSGFTEKSRSASNSEYEQDGWHVVLYRDLIGGEAVNSSKMESRGGGDEPFITVNYVWENQAWRPVRKSESYSGPIVDFEALWPESPLAPVYYTREDDFLSSISTMPWLSFSTYYRIEYSWDSSTSAWKTYNEERQTCAVEGNTLTVTTIQNGTTRQTVCRVNDARRILYFEGYNINNHAVQLTYTYDADGDLTSEADDLAHTRYDYRYGAIELTPVLGHAADTGAPRIIGRRIELPGEHLQLLDLAGRLIARGESSVVAPREGVYIVKSGQRAYKVSLRR